MLEAANLLYSIGKIADQLSFPLRFVATKKTNYLKFVQSDPIFIDSGVNPDNERVSV
ncbi:MAG: hypothetical protein ACI92S_001979 [Planctomycetaceae bacterium]|jgi:hypothetical protein